MKVKQLTTQQTHGTFTSLHSLTVSSTRASSISSSTFKSPSPDPSTMTRSPDPPASPWAWTMATRILHQSQRHTATLFTSVENHLDSLAAGPERPLHPQRPRRHPSGHLRTETVQF